MYSSFGGAGLKQNEKLFFQSISPPIVESPEDVKEISLPKERLVYTLIANFRTPPSCDH